MTTDKLPDVPPSKIYLHTECGDFHCGEHDCTTWCESRVQDGDATYVLQSALDAMTAERDALKLDRVKWRKTLMDERDSAREALAKATELLREAYDLDALRDSDESLSDAARAFLAAQPKTKT